MLTLLLIVSALLALLLLLLAAAIAVHNVPEGIAIALPLRAKGVSPLRCVFYAILTSVPQPIAAVPAAIGVPG